MVTGLDPGGGGGGGGVFGSPLQDFEPDHDPARSFKKIPPPPWL